MDSSWNLRNSSPRDTTSRSKYIQTYVSKLRLITRLGSLSHKWDQPTIIFMQRRRGVSSGKKWSHHAIIKITPRCPIYSVDSDFDTLSNPGGFFVALHSPRARRTMCCYDFYWHPDVTCYMVHLDGLFGPWHIVDGY